MSFRQGAAPSRVTPDEGPLQFNFADMGETGEDPPELDQASQGPLSVEPMDHHVDSEPPDPERHQHPESTRRSTCQPNPTRRLIETAYAVLDESDAVEDYKIQVQAEDPIAFATSKFDPDTLHYNDAMNADNLAQFKTVMLKEVNAHSDNKHWEVWKKDNVPTGQDVLPAVWAFKRKRPIDTCEGQLLRDLLPSSQLVLYLALPHHGSAFQLEDASDRLCACLSTGRS
jgi:hypothetical protein